jgi:phosphoribosylaminoimidazolecarboxamide formyltransferase/IMP cyclohydrolase
VSHNADVETARGNIDIGGPSMLRASAKNFIRVATLCDPEDYGAVVAELGSNGGTLGIRTRFRLARKAFDHTAAYDAAIASFLSDKTSDDLPYSIQE